MDKRADKIHELWKAFEKQGYQEDDALEQACAVLKMDVDEAYIIMSAEYDETYKEEVYE